MNPLRNMIPFWLDEGKTRISNALWANRERDRSPPRQSNLHHRRQTAKEGMRVRENARARARGRPRGSSRSKRARPRATVSGSRVSRSRRHTLVAPRRRGRADRHGTHARYLPIRKLRRHRRENAAFEKESPTITTDQSSTNLRWPKVAGAYLYALLSRGGHASCARARSRTPAWTYARNPPAYLSYIIAPNRVPRASVYMCVRVCAKSTPFRPTANFSRVRFSQCVPRVYSSLRRCARCASAVIRQPRLLKADGEGVVPTPD